ncbi:hypothetical protein T12_7842 [Trichinella patagoniensis]|uniref:Uncharacterized protein n=1 Tax=Trichinella patagoniensis TaxID=990121 RepID=A0A0V0ZJS6_9BILA|nr:hypothetical protein T12_7842 [Trichinella patagoniensis]
MVQLVVVVVQPGCRLFSLTVPIALNSLEMTTEQHLKHEYLDEKAVPPSHEESFAPVWGWRKILLDDFPSNYDESPSIFANSLITFVRYNALRKYVIHYSHKILITLPELVKLLAILDVNVPRETIFHLKGMAKFYGS